MAKETKEISNTRFIHGVLLLLCKLSEDDAFIMVDVAFGDDLGETFIGEVWHRTENKPYEFFFKINEDNNMERFAVWPPDIQIQEES